MTEEGFDAILETDAGRYARSIGIESLKDFVRRAIVAYGTEEKLEEANKVMDILRRMLLKRHIVSESAQLQTFYELVKTACLIHNLFYDGTLVSLFAAREKLTPIARECGLPQHEVINPLFEMVEAQLGADTPVPHCQPQPNSPQELFAEACWLVEEVHGDKCIPDC